MWKDVLRPATRAIDERFFLLPRAEAEGAWRERVYAYEFYHQMRLRWKDWGGEGLTLNGEVDKRAYEPLATTPLSTRTPDLLVHTPGTHDNNLLVLEIKSPRAKAKEHITELGKVIAFLDSPVLRYKAGALLVFGGSRDVLEEAKAAVTGRPVLIIHHARAGEDAEIV